MLVHLVRPCGCSRLRFDDGDISAAVTDAEVNTPLPIVLRIGSSSAKLTKQVP
jgi:hypothetical protein